MISIFNYLDYREYLKDYFYLKKSEHAYFSYRYMSNKIEIDPSFLVKVFHKDQHISQKSVSRFISFLKLNTQEADYFKILVSFNKAKKSHDIQKYFKLLIEFDTGFIKHLDSTSSDFYSNWYNCAIYLLLTCMPDFKGDLLAIANRLSPSVPLPDIERALMILEKADIIRKQTDGTYEIPFRSVRKGNSTNNELIKAYERQFAQLALGAFDRCSKEEHLFLSSMLSVSKDGLDKIDKVINKAFQEIVKIAEIDSNPERVYMVSLNFFPLST